MSSRRRGEYEALLEAAEALTITIGITAAKLTPAGEALIPILGQISTWAGKHLPVTR